MKRFLKSVVVAVLAVTMALTTASCVSKVDPSKDLENVLKAGKLVVAMECAYKPFNWTQKGNENGAVPIAGQNYYANGYDIQIAKYIAKELGVELEIKTGQFNAFPEDVKVNKVDAIIAGMSPTITRKLVIDFTDEYYNSNLVVVCKVGSDISKATSLEDLGKSEYKIAAQESTFHLTALREQVDGCEVKVLKDFDTMQLQLQSGLIDGYIAEKPTALVFEGDTYTYVDLENNKNGFTTNESDTSVAVGLRKGSSLLAKINEILAGISQETRDEYMKNAISWQNSAMEL